MKTLVGNTIYDVPEVDNFHILVKETIEIEEKRVLDLRACGLKTDESILIHLVRMYFLRWAIPAVEIENAGRIGNNLINDIQQRFWLCMYGRAIDDLFDHDSTFFSLEDSICLLVNYSALLNISTINRKGLEILQLTLKSLENQKIELSSNSIKFTEISNSVCQRVAYFCSLASINKDRANTLNKYIGVLLGKADLDDCIVDKCSGNNATLLSANLYKNLADNDNKIHIDYHLIKWYKCINKLLLDECKSLIRELDIIKCAYSSSILKYEMEKWIKEDKQIII